MYAQLWKVEPNSGPVGTVVEIGGYRLTWNYNSYGQIYIGDQVCDLRDSDNAQYGIRSLWGLIYVKCLTTEVRAGGWNGSTTISGASGKTWNHSRALYPMFDWTLGMYELFPGGWRSIILVFMASIKLRLNFIKALLIRVCCSVIYPICTGPYSFHNLVASIYPVFFIHGRHPQCVPSGG